MRELAPSLASPRLVSPALVLLLPRHGLLCGCCGLDGGACELLMMMLMLLLPDDAFQGLIFSDTLVSVGVECRKHL